MGEGEQGNTKVRWILIDVVVLSHTCLYDRMTSISPTVFNNYHTVD